MTEFPRKIKMKTKNPPIGGFFVSVWLQLESRERANPPNAYEQHIIKPDKKSIVINKSSK